eukprot:CAMPEP_0118855518 /NCGR_PEP_ID=MMETSP1163-20130328/3305_1 /TAXON_ID=124430 /ORGANISM="Phaeomonas parva, Strain CCMP2877" /LENGTH=293 /DNA_ID=CAMNT_0006788421 /DNA_START=180 /DNA_END=1061 /DNA_ORIENTATION=+
MFKFNFDGDADPGPDPSPDPDPNPNPNPNPDPNPSPNPNPNPDPKPNTDLLPASWQPQDYDRALGLAGDAVAVTVGEASYAKVNADGRTRIEGVAENYDVVTGVYEGGLRLWEASLDLVIYLQQAPTLRPEPTVLELGCGHGLPGIHMLLSGADDVVFSDYNREVLEGVTAPNVAANLRAQAQQRRFGAATFLAGDWGHASSGLLAGRGFDVILAAETIYTVETLEASLRMITTHLNPGGVAYVAGKRYYFGTGGGTGQLIRTPLPPGFRVEHVKEVKDGKSNIRDIVAVWRD